MASIEKFSEFADAAALNTGAPGKYQVGTSLDLGSATPGDIASGSTLYLVIQATTGITLASGSGQIKMWLASDATASFTASSATLHAGVQWNTSTTEIPAGTVLLSVALPEQGQPYERYLGIVQETITTALNAGAINAYLTTCPPKHQSYADGAPVLS